MDQRLWQEIEKILDHILAIENPKTKKQILNDACKEDPDLYNIVLTLLENIREADQQNFLENKNPFLD